MEQFNQIKISGQIVKVYSPRVTPFGIEVVSFILAHQSMQAEAQEDRQIDCRLFCIAIGLDGLHANGILNQNVVAQGFLANNKKGQMAFHLKQITFLDKGN